MEKLKKISLFLSIIGILIITTISTISQPVVVNICDLNSVPENSYIKFYGIVLNKKEINNEKIITIKNSSCNLKIKCKCNVEIGKQVEVIGKLIKYKSKGNTINKIKIYFLKQK